MRVCVCMCVHCTAVPQVKQQQLAITTDNIMQAEVDAASLQERLQYAQQELQQADDRLKRFQ